MSLSTITIGAVDYTAYASVAEADDYLAVDPVRGAAWSGLSTDTRGAHLVAATRRLDQLRWSGTKADPDQLTAWPRTAAKDDGATVASDEVPQAVEDACILLAGSIALDATVAQVGSSGSNVRSVGAGSAKVEFFRPTAGVPLADTTAYGLVQGLLAGSSSGFYGAASGTDGVSSFGNAGDPDLNDGFA